MRARRWPLGLAIVLLSMAFGSCTGESREASPTAALRARLEEAEQPERFTITYRAAGTQVLDCFLPNRHFSMDVDRDAGVVAVTAAARPGRVVARLIGETVYLHRSLFQPVTTSATWLRASADLSDEARGDLERALGADLAAYLFAGGLPSGATETAVAMLDVARAVRPLGVQLVGRRRLEGYRIDVDPDRFAAEATVPGSPSPSSTVPPGEAPVVEVWLDGNEVARLVVRREASGPTDPDATVGGWIADYTDLERPLSREEPNDVTDIDTIGTSRLRAASRGDCRLGVGDDGGGDPEAGTE